MRIGVDVDGVLADFNESFIDTVKRLTGRDLFGAGYVPTTWNYPEAVGYTGPEVTQVWDTIKANPTFWLSLRPYWDAMTALEQLRVMSVEHDLYFITSRPGVKAKHQSEVWLATHSGDFAWNPTVLISSEKGKCAKALHLDYYVDDRYENVQDVVSETRGRTFAYMVDRPWNQSVPMEPRRVGSISDFLDIITHGKTANRAA